MTISMAVGQAAGTAAALACHRRDGSNGGRIDVRQVSIPKLRAMLAKDGACRS